MWRIATKSHEMQSPKSLLQRSGASISIDGCVKLEKVDIFSYTANFSSTFFEKSSNYLRNTKKTARIKHPKATK